MIILYVNVGKITAQPLPGEGWLFSLKAKKKEIIL